MTTYASEEPTAAEMGLCGEGCEVGEEAPLQSYCQEAPQKVRQGAKKIGKPEPLVQSNLAADLYEMAIGVDDSLAVGIKRNYPMADMECMHGRLAGDETRPCGCWPDEL